MRNKLVLENRRASLGMSCQALAQRSGISRATVIRILESDGSDANTANVQAVAKALGLSLGFSADLEAEAMREQQARKKAEWIVGLVQGSSALEEQAVDAEMYQAMVRRTIHELLAGSSRKLWAAM